MVLKERIEFLVQLGQKLTHNSEDFLAAKDNAHRQNAWFVNEYVDYACTQIANNFLNKEKLNEWLKLYNISEYAHLSPKLIGIVMAGNIPLVGFHDFLCAYILGHNINIKLSSKDNVLWQYIYASMKEIDHNFSAQVQFAEMLKGCDAYIATGSNNTARYFEQYFQKYPNIIRKNRTSVAVLDGTETKNDLEKLANDISLYFGLGCRNVTQIVVPKEYNFENFLQTFDKYKFHREHNKYKNNYDYQLALYLLNKVPYMSNESILMVANEMPYAPVSVVHYAFYEDFSVSLNQLEQDDTIQCIAVNDSIFSNHNNEFKKTVSFGNTQYPLLSDYADGIDTLDFLMKL